MRKHIAILRAATLVLGAAVIWAAPQPKPAAQSSSVHRAPTRSSPSLLNPSSLRLQAPAVFAAKFVTGKGDFVVQVTRAWSPRGADRFYNLVKYHYFTGAAFFRIVPGFVVQFGISARPDVNRAWENAKISDDSVTQTNSRGTLTFATAGPSTRTTQIFINLGDNAQLDQQGFSPFGKIVSGMDVVDKLYSGYGDGPPDGQGPDQNRLQREGGAYLGKSFPLLDVIKSAFIVPVPAAAPAKPATASTGKSPTTSK